MKKVFLLVLSIALLSSCDFIRKVASRPTSVEIAAKKAQIEKIEQARAARIDSLSSASNEMIDSISVESGMREACSSIISAGRISGLEASRLKYKYYIIVGSFSNTANADKLAAVAQDAGYPVTRISFSNGFSAVALCGGNVLKLVVENLDSVRKESFCPQDVWILSNE